MAGDAEESRQTGAASDGIRHCRRRRLGAAPVSDAGPLGRGRHDVERPRPRISRIAFAMGLGGVGGAPGGCDMALCTQEGEAQAMVPRQPLAVSGALPEKPEDIERFDAEHKKWRKCCRAGC